MFHPSFSKGDQNPVKGFVILCTVCREGHHFKRNILSCCKSQERYYKHGEVCESSVPVIWQFRMFLGSHLYELKLPELKGNSDNAQS